jgi:DNA-binding NarL/FixJ family response regulator
MTGGRECARVVLVDDHELVRAGLRRLLAGARELEIIGEASSGGEALVVCQRLRPDLVLMDLHLRDMDGLAVTRAIRGAGLGTSVLLFTMYEGSAYVDEAQRAGAAGYLLKGASRRELLDAVRHALKSSGQSVSVGLARGLL